MAIPAFLQQPDIRLFGSIDAQTLQAFLQAKKDIQHDGPVVLELTTDGGDADIGRRIALEITHWQNEGREIYFLGKSSVFSAGVTIMAAFKRANRFATHDCEFLVHERKLDKRLVLEGSLRVCEALLKNALAEIASGQRLQREGFSDLARGSNVDVETIELKLQDRDWYFDAEEAQRLGFIEKVI